MPGADGRVKPGGICQEASCFAGVCVGDASMGPLHEMSSNEAQTRPVMRTRMRNMVRRIVKFRAKCKICFGFFR